MAVITVFSTDSWRFYADPGLALSRWAQRYGAIEVDRGDRIRTCAPVHVPRTAPVVRSREDVIRQSRTCIFKYERLSFAYKLVNRS